MARMEKMNVDNLQLSPVNTSVLTEEQKDRIRAYKALLGEVASASVEEAIEDFTRDTHPEREIKVWEKITSVYLSEMQHRSQDDRFEVFGACLYASMSDYEDYAAFASSVSLVDAQRIYKRINGKAE